MNFTFRMMKWFNIDVSQTLKDKINLNYDEMLCPRNSEGDQFPGCT